MGADHWDEQVGSVADEAHRLLESLRRSAADLSDPGPPSAGTVADAGQPVREQHDEAGPDAADGAPSCVDPFCTYCPLCRSAAVIRSLSPETLAHLADLATVAATVLADLASARRSSTDDDERAAARPARPEPSPPQPIPVRDVDDPQEAPRG